MELIKKTLVQILKVAMALGILALMVCQAGCATGQSKNIALGMLAGAVVGGVVGHEFVHHGDHKQYETQNTIISAVVFSLVTGGALAWHYNELQEQSVEISGRYARYRLCNPEEMNPDLAQKLGPTEEKSAYVLQPHQFGKYAISLDDETKWAYPIFRKRYLLPEREETQVTSSRYIWEILKPGSFVTRSQNPQYFLQEEQK